MKKPIFHAKKKFSKQRRNFVKLHKKSIFFKQKTIFHLKKEFLILNQNNIFFKGKNISHPFETTNHLAQKKLNIPYTSAKKFFLLTTLFQT